MCFSRKRKEAKLAKKREEEARKAEEARLAEERRKAEEARLANMRGKKAKKKAEYLLLQSSALHKLRL